MVTLKVLVACEESQRVCTAFRERGHEAYSCDIQECSGGHPEWHIMGDVLNVIDTNAGGTSFMTMDGVYHEKNYKRHRRVRRKHLDRVKRVDQSLAVRYI
jgi:hypothetical protein